MTATELTSKLGISSATLKNWEKNFASWLSPDYKNGKIYTIRCRTDNNLIYVGSTIQPLHKRFHGHKMKLLNGGYNHRFLYNKMSDLGIDNFYIELYCKNLEFIFILYLKRLIFGKSLALLKCPQWVFWTLIRV